NTSLSVSMKAHTSILLVLFTAPRSEATDPPRHSGRLRSNFEKLVGALRLGKSDTGSPPLGGICDNTVVQHHGYLPGRGHTKLFYWLFDSRHNPRESPTVIYFQGGPGVSSLFSAVSGNGGPCIVDDIGNNTSMN
ncbi:hypothetical protein FOZ63_009367, partial [Perkinsus olseni]